MSNLLSADQLRDAWLDRLFQLIGDVECWAGRVGWSTRRVEIAREDSEIGKYKAPALLLQQEATRILLEPIARSTPGSQGVVDLYLMPAYDDIACLYRRDNGWHVHYMFPDSPTVGTLLEAEAQPLTEEVLQAVLEAMRANTLREV
jgi:hypothetical protein